MPPDDDESAGDYTCDVCEMNFDKEDLDIDEDGEAECPECGEPLTAISDEDGEDDTEEDDTEEDEEEDTE